jgi:hypothetical protein
MTRVGTILVAIIKAALLWGLLNVAVSQCFVVYHWNDYHPIVVQQIVKEIIVEKILEPVIEEEIVVVPVHPEVQKEPITLDPHIKNRNQQLLQDFQKSIDHHADQLREMKSRVNLVQHNSKQPTIYPKMVDPINIYDFSALRTLLVLPTLANADMDWLNHAWTTALREVDLALSTKTAMDLIKAFLTWDFQRIQASEVPSNCPVRPTGARASDLRALMGTVHHALGDQRKGRSIGRLLEPIKVQEFMSLPLVLPESLDDAGVEYPDDTQEDRLAPGDAAAPPDQDRMCLLEEDLVDMVDFALQRAPAELQLALTEFVKQLDPDSDLILDALLPPPSTLGSLPTRPASPTNLRQVLNSEWLYYGSTKLIDALVDWTSGYHDGIDAALDSLIQKHPGDDSVGRIVVSHLLHMAGKIPVPQPIVNIYNTTQAGMLAKL